MKENRFPTSRQLDVLRFISQHISAHRWAPTVRAIGAHFGWASTKAVFDHLVALERKGLLKRGAGPRALAVTPRGQSWLLQHPEAP